MFVDPTRGRARKLVLATATGALAVGACGDPEQNTDLRPDGPPEVLAVLVMTDPVAQIGETATYCAPNDPKRPDSVGLPDFTYVQICDDDLSVGAEQVTNAYPDGWYVRIMFDELLDPDVEELVETGDGETYSGTLKNTKPVTLECESVNGGFVEVPYDGYYNPAGNRVTWPLGPSLVVKPDDPRAIATGKTCRITIKEKVTDKTGTPVPEAQRGPYEFKIAPITPIYIDPPDGSEVTALSIFSDNVYVQFNTEPDPTSFCTQNSNDPFDGCDPTQPISFQFTNERGYCSTTGDVCDVSMNGADCPTAGDTCERWVYAYSLQPYGFTGSEFGFGPFEPLETEKEYTFSFVEGGTVKDRCGVATTFGAPSVADNTQITFTTAPFDLASVTPTDGDTVAALRRPTFTFTNVIDMDSIGASELSIDPEPASFSLRTSTGGNVILGGYYAPETKYTVQLAAGATVDDYYGVTFTNGGAIQFSFTTQPIAITGTSPANGGQIVKATPASPTRIALAFNQAMNPASIDASEVEFSGGVGIGTPIASGCGVASTSCSILIPTDTPLAPGSYSFTLKAGATVEDVLGNVYTQAADRVINFTVVDAEPDAPVQCL
jgi:hypothetical protein